MSFFLFLHISSHCHSVVRPEVGAVFILCGDNVNARSAHDVGYYCRNNAIACISKAYSGMFVALFDRG